MTKQAVQDQARLMELKERIYGGVAQNLTETLLDPYLLRESQIESHGGRIKRALKLLFNTQIISNHGKSDDNKTLYMVIPFNEEAQSFEKEPKFETTWQELYANVMGSLNRVFSEEDFSLRGYRTLRSLSAAEKIHIWYHHEDYLFDGMSYTQKPDILRHGVYPRVSDEARQKAVLKAIVERHFQNDFPCKLETYLGLPEGALSRKDTIRNNYRNFSKHPITFSAEYFEGAQGFEAEYEHYTQYTMAMYRELQEFKALVKAHGGYVKIIEEMRRDSITKIRHNAPKDIHYQARHYNGSRDLKEIDKFAAIHVLKKGRMFNYETLYGEDSSMGHIYWHGVTKDAFAPFTPDENALKLIAKHKEIPCPTNPVESDLLLSSPRMTSKI